MTNAKLFPPKTTLIHIADAAIRFGKDLRRCLSSKMHGLNTSRRLDEACMKMPPRTLARFNRLLGNMRRLSGQKQRKCEEWIDDILFSTESGVESEEYFEQQAQALYAVVESSKRLMHLLANNTKPSITIPEDCEYLRAIHAELPAMPTWGWSKEVVCAMKTIRRDLGSLCTPAAQRVREIQPSSGSRIGKSIQCAGLRIAKAIGQRTIDSKSGTKGHATIAPRHRTRPMSYRRAAKLMGKANSKDAAEWLSASVRDGSIPCEHISRQSHVFSKRSFPEKVWRLILPDSSETDGK